MFLPIIEIMIAGYNCFRVFLAMSLATMDKHVFYLLYKQLRMFMYYFIILNILRFFLAYKNKLEYSSTNNTEMLLEVIIFVIIGDLFRFVVGCTSEQIVSYEFKLLRKFGKKDANGNLLNDKNHIYGINIDKLHSLTCEFIGYNFILSLITAILVILICAFVHFTGFYLLTFLLFKYIVINFLVKYNLILNSFIRQVGDSFGKSPASVFASTLQVIIPVIGYLYFRYVNLVINLKIMIFFAFLGGCCSVLINSINIYFIFNRRIFYPSFKNIRRYMYQTLYIFPGQILRNIFTFSFVDILMLTTPLYFSRDLKLNLILAYKPFRNMYGITILPFMTSLRLTAVQAENDRVFLSSSYVSSLLIAFISSIVIALFIETKMYSKVFYVREDFGKDTINLFLYAFPLQLSAKTLEMFNAINGNNTFYNLFVFLHDIGAILLFNLVCYYVFGNNIENALAYTIIFQSIFSYFMNLIIAKYYDNNKEVNVLFDLGNSSFLFMLFITNFRIFSYIFKCYF